jgi:hypothetical protein
MQTVDPRFGLGFIGAPMIFSASAALNKAQTLELSWSTLAAAGAALVGDELTPLLDG